MKENKTQQAVRKRNEILEIVQSAFLEARQDEDNSWRVKHNLILLNLQLEPLLFNYFLKEKSL